MRHPAPLQRPPRLVELFQQHLLSLGMLRPAYPGLPIPRVLLMLVPVGRAPVWEPASTCFHNLLSPVVGGCHETVVVHGTAPCLLLWGCWDPEHGDVESKALAWSSPGLKCVSWIGEGGDFPAGADAVPGAWGCLSLPCTRSAGKGLRVAPVKVCRCWGPAEPLSTVTLSLQRIHCADGASTRGNQDGLVFKDLADLQSPALLLTVKSLVLNSD